MIIVRIVVPVVDVAGRDIVVLGHSVINLQSTVLVLFTGLAGKKQQPRNTIGIGQVRVWIEPENPLHDWIESDRGIVISTARSCDVQRLRGPTDRVGVGEHSSFESRGGNRRGIRAVGNETASFVVGEEESLSLDNRTANRHTIKVAHV